MTYGGRGGSPGVGLVVGVGASVLSSFRVVPLAVSVVVFSPVSG